VWYTMKQVNGKEIASSESAIIPNEEIYSCAETKERKSCN
jgi:hypothetical protein